MEYTLDDLLLIKNKDKRLQIKNQIILNHLIAHTINYNTFINQETKSKLSRIEKLLKNNSLYENLVTDSNKHVLNTMPYMLFGLVETTFVDEEKNRKTNEYGCGIVIGSNVILLPGKNLVYEESPSEQEEGNEEENMQQNNKNNYKLFEIEFKPLNISPEYRSYLPKAIKVENQYTPLNGNMLHYNPDTEDEEDGEIESTEEHKNTNTNNANGNNSSINKRIKEGTNEDNNDNNNEDVNKREHIDRLYNNWGLALLDYPIGDVLNFIYHDSQKKDRNNHIKSSRTKNMYEFESPDHNIMNLIQIKPLSDDDIQNFKLYFLECFPKDIATLNSTYNEEQSNIDDEESNIEPSPPKYMFHESNYDTCFDKKMIYLKNSNQNPQLDDNILPGFIVGEYLGKFYILGISTNTVFKHADEETVEQENNTQDVENVNNNETIYHIAIRFGRAICELMNLKICELEEHYPNDMKFNTKLFTLINNKIKNKNQLFNLFKNNCEQLYSFINEIKDDKSLTLNEKNSLALHNDSTLKFIQFALMLIYNKYTSSSIESKIIDFENSKMGYFPGSSILSEIIRSKESLSTLNLKNNDLFDEGIKEIMLPIYSKKKILDTGKVLKCLCLDSNKLSGKSLKYIRYLIKLSPQLSLMSFSNNNIKGSSLRHLINATKGKDQMTILHLHNNLLGSSCGSHLNAILTNLTKLIELNLSCNCIGDEPIPLILETLKKNARIEILYLSNNDITQQSASSIANFLSNNKFLEILWLNNNPLSSEGLTAISQALSTKLCLSEINLNSTSAGDNGGKELFDNLKMNKSIRRLFINANDLGIESMKKFGELMRKDNENEGSEGGIEFISMNMNKIDDECVKYFVDDLVEYRWLRELKLNSNIIGNEGGEKLLCAVLRNPAFSKLCIENNNLTFSINDDFFNYKEFRGDIQIDV